MPGWCIFRAFPVLDGFPPRKFRKSDSLDPPRIHADGMQRMVVIWANKSEWKKPGPIVAMGLLNAWSCAEAGYETHFYVGAGEESETLRDLAEFYGVPAHENLHLHRTGRGAWWKEWFGRKIYFDSLNHAHRLAKEGQRVLFVTRELGLVPMLARMRRKLPEQIIALHETHDFHADLAHAEKVDLTRRRKSWCEKGFLPHLNGLVCITGGQAALYREAFPKLPVTTLPLGTLELEPAPVEERRARRTVGYVGHLHASKGVHGILKMVQALADAGVKLSLFGGYPDQIESLRGRLREIDARSEDMVSFHPFRPPVKLHRDLGRELSLMLVPLKDTHYNRFLTCPVKALDALSHGIPTVASDLPTTRELLGESAAYIEPGKIKPAVKAVVEILDDPARYAAMAGAAEARAAELAWKKRATRLIEFAEGVTRKRKKGEPPNALFSWLTALGSPGPSGK